MDLSILYFFVFFICNIIKTINIGLNCLLIQIKNRERPHMIIQQSLTPYVTKTCFSNWKSIKKMLTRGFIPMQSKKMFDDNEIIDEFKKKYHIKCHIAPHNCEEDDDVDFMGLITPQTGDNTKVVKYFLYLLKGIHKIY